MRIITRRSAIQALAGVPCLMRGEDRGTAFALIGDRYHNSDYMRIGLGKTLGKDAGVGIDFCDEVKMLSAANLRGYKLLIVFRDGMLWPDGYSDENSNAAYARMSNLPIVSEPPVPKHEAKPSYWITPGTRQGSEGVRVRGRGRALLSQCDLHQPA